ncbi:MAG TPA: FeoA family protein [bacterium]
MNKIDLTVMQPGQKGKVIEIQGGRGMAMKLEALEIRPGVEITKVSTQIMHGPVIVGVGKAQVAIGFGIARRIIVKPADNDRSQ